MKSRIASHHVRRPRVRLLCIAVGLLLGGHTVAAFAQDAAPSTNATINLIHLMVKKGLLTQTEADGLLKEANDEAVQARKVASSPVPPDGAQPGDVRAVYVPQNVRNEIRDQVKQEVIAQAKSEHWAEPNALPGWLDRISWFGDLHVRDESWLYSRNNANDFIDYGAFNRTGPIDINPFTQSKATPPILDSTQNRINLFRLQAHIGMNVKLGDTIAAGVRIGSGGDNNPVSTTQTLGGGLIKKDIWLDQAWVRWQPYKQLSLTAGRMPDPFEVTDLIYSTELNFDGVAEQSHLSFSDDLGGFATLGGFPIQYNGPDAPQDAYSNLKSNNGNKWLWAAQAGFKWNFADDAQWKVALAYYFFDRMQGQLSAPCEIYTGINYCSTDNTAPMYMQKGNTVFLLRDIVPDPSSPDNYAQPQLVGLSYNYHIADLVNKVDFKVGETPIEIQAEYERNLAYHARDAFNRYPFGLGVPIDNYQSGSTPGTNGPYKSGPVGWLLRGIIGNPHPMAANEWNIALGYKYLQPDAMLDGLTDQNFHLGGTNAKGFILTADYGIAPRTWVSARYYGAKQVYGPPFTLDVVQFEISTNF